MTSTGWQAQWDLEGRSAVVTGGGGLLGAMFSLVLAAAGARVAVLDVDAEAAGRTVRRIEREVDGTAEAITCDVADAARVAAVRDDLVSRWGAPSILVNNAATKTADPADFFQTTERTSVESWRSIMSVNLDGMFHVARAFGTVMAQTGGGSIIQTASIYGVVGPDLRIYEGMEFLGAPMTSPPAYSASKAAVIGLTRHLAVEWGGAGVRVNALVPGGVRSGQDPEFIRRYAARVPMGRMAEPDEMAGPVLFLASDASSYVTGQVLAVDGGFLAW